MNLKFRHIRALQAIQAHGSFGRAAAELGVVPSALSETIRQLEDSIGAPLFDRTQRPPAPTQVALRFLQEAAPLMDGLERAALRLRSDADRGAGTLAIGSTPSAITHLVAPAITRFRDLHPNARLHVHDDIAEVLAERVVEGKLEIAIAGRARHSEDLRQSELTRDPFGLACVASHPLAGRKSIQLEEIDPAEIISLDPGTGTQALLSTARAVPADLRIGTIEAHSTIAQISMIRAGLGVALMPRNALMLFGDPLLRFVPVDNLDLWRSLYLLVPVQRRPSALARAFIDLLEAH